MIARLSGKVLFAFLLSNNDVVRFDRGDIINDIVGVTVSIFELLVNDETLEICI